MKHFEAEGNSDDNRLVRRRFGYTRMVRYAPKTVLVQNANILHQIRILANAWYCNTKLDAGAVIKQETLNIWIFVSIYMHS